MKKTFVIAWLCFIGACIAALFWYNQYRYQLPTPVPEGYIAVPKGTKIHLPAGVASKNSKPLLLHFFNPDCPCSRFNVPEFRKLANSFADSVDFAVVIMNNTNYTAEEVQRKYDITCPVITDTSLATLCGVYSTPQAVVLDQHQNLFYRGNYNRNRYCTDEKTNYARFALNEVIQKKQTSGLTDAAATTAYGCPLTKCLKPQQPKLCISANQN